jgi:hypothetical protein
MSSDVMGSTRSPSLTGILSWAGFVAERELWQDRNYRGNTGSGGSACRVGWIAKTNALWRRRSGLEQGTFAWG